MVPATRSCGAATLSLTSKRSSLACNVRNVLSCNAEGSMLLWLSGAVNPRLFKAPDADSLPRRFRSCFEVENVYGTSVVSPDLLARLPLLLQVCRCGLKLSCAYIRNRRKMRDSTQIIWLCE
jgi:hypothetical protein